jgi:hypothetical protein
MLLHVFLTQHSTTQHNTTQHAEHAAACILNTTQHNTTLNIQTSILFLTQQRLAQQPLYCVYAAGVAHGRGAGGFSGRAQQFERAAVLFLASQSHTTTQKLSPTTIGL